MMMDEMLNRYINDTGCCPPTITEREIVAALNRRQKRTAMILLALAGLLWALVFYGFAFRVGIENQPAGIALLLVTIIGYMCAGALASIVFHIRKVGI